MQPKTRYHHIFKKTLATNGPVQRKIVTFPIQESPVNVWENRAKEHNSHITSAIYQHSVFNNHPKANLSHFKLIDQDRKQVVRKATEDIHSRIKNPCSELQHEKKCTSWKSSTTFFDQKDYQPYVRLGPFIVTFTLCFQVTCLPEQCAW